jgi:hypothetical protein
MAPSVHLVWRLLSSPELMSHHLADDCELSPCILLSPVEEPTCRLTPLISLPS